ncbi:hypothetical protein AGR7A_Lc140038 [Agrobacterium deltaense NCPPB 1641]|uniref:Uncharacterized protein n=1 Tax=Agrobacterium deltaense NCPPB 1641 TaxID=1183425 RepID=A0A1S7U296_9HYPH|nr:hypothetical protein AGR7A_Lc140038 [Agrobacterium deltaense NCPPB 1641]
MRPNTDNGINETTKAKYNPDVAITTNDRSNAAFTISSDLLLLNSSLMKGIIIFVVPFELLLHNYLSKTLKNKKIFFQRYLKNEKRVISLFSVVELYPLSFDAFQRERYVIRRIIAEYISHRFYARYMLAKLKRSIISDKRFYTFLFKLVLFLRLYPHRLPISINLDWQRIAAHIEIRKIIFIVRKERIGLIERQTIPA